MEQRRLVILGVAVTALVAVAALASHGRPLAGSGAGRGPTAGFFDYFFTTTAIFGIVVVGVVAWAIVALRPGDRRSGRGRNHLVSYLLAVAVGVAFAELLLHDKKFIARFRALDQAAQRKNGSGRSGAQPGTIPGSSRAPRLRWDEVAIVAALLAGAAALAYAGRTKTRKRPPSWRRRSQEAVSVALDESLDDLRNDPDLRRAIVAAYARMETALGYAGIPRHPAEAPLEYMERALTSLDTSAAAARRLTVLFEWAKFSQHEPEPEMRDEAIDALVAVRDELRRPAEDAVAA